MYIPSQRCLFVAISLEHFKCVFVGSRLGASIHRSTKINFFLTDRQTETILRITDHSQIEGIDRSAAKMFVLDETGKFSVCL